MKKIKIACTFIASLVGAGFASGREISLYFGNSSPVVAAFSGLLCGFFCYVCLFLGKRGGGQLLSYMFGPTLPAAETAARLCNFVIYCAMVAGMEFLFYSAFSIRGAGAVSGILAVITVLSGIEKIKWINFLSVPLILISVIIVFFKQKPTLNFSGDFNFGSGFLYVGMNVFTGGYLVSEFSDGLSDKDCLFTGAITAAALGVLLTIMYFIIQEAKTADMPLHFICERESLTLISVVILFTSIFTTMTGSLYVVAKSRPETTLLTASGGFVFSLFGFSVIVNTVYPIIGAIGLIFSAFAVFKWIKALRSESRLSL